MITKNIAIICKASIIDGLGHLFRSKTFAYGLLNVENISIDFILIGDNELEYHFDNHNFEFLILKSDEDIKLNKVYHVVFFDMLSISEIAFNYIKKKSQKLVSLSPVFDHLNQMNVLVHRTKYLPKNISNSNLKLLAGLNYTILRQGLNKIPIENYEHSIAEDAFQISISMGGADAANDTLKIIKSLKSIDKPLLIWVFLGEGYVHSYKQIADAIKNDKNHELILVRSNRSNWKLMKNTTMAILAGGITSYEAAYCGLPAINYFAIPERMYLVRELEEKALCFKSLSNIEEIGEKIYNLIQNPITFINMNKKSNSEIFNILSPESILKKCLETN